MRCRQYGGEPFKTLNILPKIPFPDGSRHPKFPEEHVMGVRLPPPCNQLLRCPRHGNNQDLGLSRLRNNQDLRLTRLMCNYLKQNFP